ncbi:MAG: TonB-dependent receptor [Bacteroidia bacterium]
MLIAQDSAWVQCVVHSRQNVPIPNARLTIGQKSYFSDSSGKVSFRWPKGRYTVEASHLNYYPERQEVELLAGGRHVVRFILVEREIEMPGVTVQGQAPPPTQLPEVPFMQTLPIRPQQMRFMPSGRSDIESRLGFMGAQVSSEFSSQYRVRGGNFDENLIYANGIEIYRPFFPRSGQQEGLGFTNVNLIEEVQFSAGGFDASYNDKMSSVLSVKYRKSETWTGSVEAGLMTLNAAVLGKWRSTYLTAGVRRFAIGYWLNRLPVKGQYRPEFYDGQIYLSGKLNGPTEKKPFDRLWWEALGVGTYNNYRFIPQTGEASFGRIDFPKRLIVYYFGRERTVYRTLQVGGIVGWRPSLRFQLRHIASFYQSFEDEVLDVEGAYLLGDIVADPGSPLYNEVVNITGAGSEIRRARNFLDIRVGYLEQRGEIYWDSLFRWRFQWGCRVQKDFIQDRFKEWYAQDSADYVRMDELIYVQNTLSNTRFLGFVQQKGQLGSFVVVGGMRFHYWQSAQKVIFTPRFQLLYQAPTKTWQARFALGAYFQPPFYREMRDINNRLDLKTGLQKSWHWVAGLDYTFSAFGRPFKFFGEVYYKSLTALVPYEVENVRLRYYSGVGARGYAYGMDLRLNGEFLRGLDSWFSLGLLRTREKIGDTLWMRRPSDQRLVLAFYFQDELPLNPNYTMHVQFIFGSGLPFGVPRLLYRRTVFQMPFYNRVDLGLGRRFILDKKFLRQLWVGLEIFNLFQRQNVVSYQWVKDVYNIRWAVPNYLSARLVNLRLIGDF